MPFLTKIVGLNPAHGEVYSIQYNVIKVVSDLQQVCVFSCSSCFVTNNTDRHDIAEILLNVALNTITLSLTLAQTPLLFRFRIKYNSSLIKLSK